VADEAEVVVDHIVVVPNGCAGAEVALEEEGRGDFGICVWVFEGAEGVGGLAEDAEAFLFDGCERRNGVIFVLKAC
jgi:hypothetical protein